MKTNVRIIKIMGCILAMGMYFAGYGVMAEATSSNSASLKKARIPASNLKIRINVNKTRIEMGRSVDVVVSASLPDGKPAVGQLALTYVNGKRWSAHEYTDKRGRATIQFPLPNPGIAEIQVEIQGNTR